MITIKSNVIFSTIPNLVINFLKNKGLKEQHAEFLGQTINSALILAKGSGAETSVSIATHAFCKHILGWRHENATLMGNVAATVINTSKKLTPIGLAHTTIVAMGSYTTNKVGKIVSQNISKMLLNNISDKK